MHMIGMDLASGKDRQSLAIIGPDGVPSMIIDRDELNGKNASRKADRDFIARAICAIVERHGATVKRTPTSPTLGYCGAGIDLQFFLNGVGAMLSVDNLHGGSWSLIHWHNTEHPSRNFAGRFNRAVGDVRSRLHHKATSHPRDWYSLAMLLDGGLCLAARQDAFEPFDL